MPKLRWIAILAVLVAASSRGSWSDEKEDADEPASEARLTVGTPAPAIVSSTWLNTKSGKSPLDGEGAGKVVMIEFWGTWCGPCVRSMPHVQDLHERYESRGLQVVAITREPPDKVKSWIAERRYTMPVGCDPEQETVRAYHLSGWPSTFLVDKEGKLAFVGDPYSVEPAIEKALGLESGPGTLLTAYLDALASKDAAKTRESLHRLTEKAGAKFDLKAWARGALGAEPPGTAPADVDGAKALDQSVAAAKSGAAANRAKALTPLAQAGPDAFDLRDWARTSFAKVYPLTKEELKADLDASRFGTALEALFDRDPPAAILDAAGKHTALVGYCKAKRTDVRADARRALMAVHYVFAETPMKGLDAGAQKKFWSDISVSGMAFDDERKKVMGVLIGGKMVTRDDAPEFVRRTLSIHALMTSIVDGKPMKPTAARDEAAKEEEDIVAELKRTY